MSTDPAELIRAAHGEIDRLRAERDALKRELELQDQIQQRLAETALSLTHEPDALAALFCALAALDAEFAPLGCGISYAQGPRPDGGGWHWRRPHALDDKIGAHPEA